MVWSNIFFLMGEWNLKVNLIKVKAHDGIWGNKKADKLAKEGLEEERITTKDKEFTNNYHLTWYNHKVEKNSRKFLKLLNDVDHEIEENGLKRMRDKNLTFDKNITLAVLNDNKELSDKGRKRKFLILKENKRKSFKYKLLIEELLTLQSLKRRLPKIYKKDLLCIRCNNMEETHRHLWECKEMNNDRNHLERTTLENLKNLIDKEENFIDKDELLEKLFKYCKTEKTLKSYNNQGNVKIYKNLGKIDLEHIYIWDGEGSLDNLIEGWIPKSMINTMFLYQKNKNKENIKKLILTLAKKINDTIYNIFWKERNNAINT